MANVVIYGNRSIAELVYYELKMSSLHEVCAFVVDREYRTSDTLLGLPVVPFDEISLEYPPDRFEVFVAVGYVRMNKLRAERCAQIKELGYRLLRHVSPRAVTWGDVTVGENTFVSASAIVNPSAHIGANVFVGAGCVLAHDCVIEDHCFFSDKVVLAGGVFVGSYSYLGTGATVRNHVKIGRECVIGVGAVVLADTEDRAVYMGQPSEQLPITSDKLNLA